MMKIHGTPIGGSRQDVARFLTGRHALVPYFRQDDMPVVAEVCQSFVLDNSAFTIWRQGGEMDYEGYLAFVEQWRQHPGFMWAIIPDVIEGDEKANDRFLERWDTKAKGVPVWHLHESIDRMKRLCNDYEIVAIGGSPVYPNLQAPAWWGRIEEVMSAICDEEGCPPCKLHGLRMLNPDVFTRLPLASADSANAGRNNHNGKYPQPTAAQRAQFIANQIEAYNSAAVWTRSPQINLFNYL